MEKRKRTSSKPKRIAATIKRLTRIDLPDLRRLHRETFGEDPLTTNTNHVRRKLAWHFQAEAEGDLPDSARQHALAIAREVDLRVRVRSNLARQESDLPIDRTATTEVVPLHDPRLPAPGSLLMREFKGQTVITKVLVDGFEYDGRRFTSLSAVAREITGTRWNGFAFWGLNKEKKVAC